MDCPFSCILHFHTKYRIKNFLTSGNLQKSERILNLSFLSDFCFGKHFHHGLVVRLNNKLICAIS